MNEPNKVAATLIVDIAGEFYDDDATEETLRYWAEQDLEDAGFDVSARCITRCRDCKHAVMTAQDQVKYCKCWQGDEGENYGGDPLYLDGDFYCASGVRRERT